MRDFYGYIYTFMRNFLLCFQVRRVSIVLSSLSFVAVPQSGHKKCIIRKTKCFRPAKRNVQKAKRNVFVLDTLPNHIKIALERLSCQILTLFLYLLISVYPITTSRVSISANFKPQSFAALNNSFSSTASMATSTSLSASSLKYFSVFCF